jgi:hypothetical protein
MKQVGAIYCKPANKEIEHDAAATRRKTGFVCSPKEIWRDSAKELQFDKSQCTNATLKECSQIQMKSTSDYYDDFSNSNATNPVLEETIRNCASGSSFHDSLFDSLTPFEDKKPKPNIIVNKLLSLQTLFKEMKELIRM